MSVKPDFWKDSQQNSRKTKKHERRVAKKLGGRRISGSGAVPLSRENRVFATTTAFGEKESGRTHTSDGDISTPRFHVEHKRTKAKSFSIKKDDLRKVARGARRTGKEPAFAVTFLEGDAPVGEEWIMIPMSAFRRLMEDQDE